MDRAKVLMILWTSSILAVRSTQAQDVAPPVTTVQGGSLRGHGQLLKGMARYEWNAARARELDVKTAHDLDQWNLEIYCAYQYELYASVARRASVRNEWQDDAIRRLAVREQRLRNEPNVDDFPIGGVLNASLLGLSDPTISESTWRYANVALPDSLAILPVASLLRRGLEELRNRLKTRE
jgi:hypothetical protein